MVAAVGSKLRPMVQLQYRCHHAISQFTVTICACADKGHSDQDCEIAIDLKILEEPSCKPCHVHQLHISAECPWESTHFNKFNKSYSCCSSIECWEYLHSNASLKDMLMFGSLWYMGSFVLLKLWTSQLAYCRRRPLTAILRQHCNMYGPLRWNRPSVNSPTDCILPASFFQTFSKLYSCRRRAGSFKPREQNGNRVRMTKGEVNCSLSNKNPQ